MAWHGMAWPVETYLHFGSTFGEAVFTGLTGIEKGELSMQMGCSLLPPGSGEDMMLQDTFLSQEESTHAVETKIG